jgi:protein-disulfide isomerase
LSARGNRLGWRIAMLAAAAAGASVTVWAAGTGDKGALDRASIEAVVRAYILDHPEIIPEALDRLQERETAKVVAANRARIETPFAGTWAGDPKGDVVLVEFFDYACVYCRATNPHIARLLSEDPHLKVVWREYPVLGPDSEQAAVSSLAAAQAGRFRAFHDSLFATARPTPTAIAAAREAAAITPPTLTEAFRGEIRANYELVRALGGSGTPTFVVGDQMLQGAVGYDALKQAIAAARRRS